MEEGVIGLIGNWKASNKAWNEAKRENRPYLFIVKLRKYGEVRYDMFTMDMDLSEGAVTEIRKLWEELVDRNKQRWDSIFKNREIMYGFGNTAGYSAWMTIDKCKEFCEEIYTIIFNEKNRQPLIAKYQHG